MKSAEEREIVKQRNRAAAPELAALVDRVREVFGEIRIISLKITSHEICPPNN